MCDSQNWSPRPQEDKSKCWVIQSQWNGEVHIVKTIWRLESRLKEHKDACNGGQLEKSAIADYAWRHNHHIEWSNLAVIDQASRYKELLVKEALHIWAASGREIINRNKGVKLCDCWMAAVRRCGRLFMAVSPWLRAHFICLLWSSLRSLDTVHTFLWGLLWQRLTKYFTSSWDGKTQHFTSLWDRMTRHLDCPPLRSRVYKETSFESHTLPWGRPVEPGWNAGTKNISWLSHWLIMKT